MRGKVLLIGKKIRRRSSRMVVPKGSRGMKDPDVEVRSETARAMLTHRYTVTPKFKGVCAYPPCKNPIEGYQRTGKRKKYCSAAHNTAACRYRQKLAGYGRVTRNGVTRVERLADLEADRGG